MLGKFVHEVTDNLSVEDVNNWIAYDRLKAEYAKKRRKRGKKQPNV